MTPSRRDLVELHARDPVKLRRCPVCRGVIEADQDEAMVMHGVWRRLRDLVDSRESPLAGTVAAASDDDFAFAGDEFVVVEAPQR